MEVKNTTKNELDTTAQIVYQRGFGLIREGKIGTLGLGPCIAWVGYAQEGNLLLLAHIDSMTELPSSIATIVSWINHAGIKVDNIGTTIMGGDPSTLQLRNRFKNLLEDYGFENIKDLNPESLPNVGPRTFIVDASDGVIKSNVIPAKPETPEERNSKLLRTQIPTRSGLQPEIIKI